METAPTSPFVMAFVSLATAAIVYAYVCEIRQESMIRRVRAYVESAHPNLWQALNWLHRSAMGGKIGLKALSRGALSDDPEFSRRYAPIARLEKNKLVGIVVGGVCIAVAVGGTMLWGWGW